MSAAIDIDALLDFEEPLIVSDTLYFDRNRLDFVRLASAQEEWGRITDQSALWRAANSVGKSYYDAYDIIHTARGTHPLRPVKAPPVLLYVFGYSWAQMDQLCEKLWQLLPKDEIDPRVHYVKMNGFRGFEVPNIPFVAGPGAGSVIAFATYEQGTGRFMGVQADGAWLDEPPPEPIFGEVRPRLNARKGTLRITFTPTPSSPPLQYLRELIKEHKESDGARGLREYQTSLTPDAVTPRGTLARPALVEPPRMTQAEIDKAVDGYLAVEREMRAHGAWDPVRVGRWLEKFSDENVRVDDPVPGARVIVGIDYGTQAGKTAAVLGAFAEMHTLQGRAWWLGEARPEGFTSTTQDAIAILEMIAGIKVGGRALAFDDVDEWWGDRPVQESRRLVGKSNERLRMALAAELGRNLQDIPKIRVPYKHTGSVRHGAQLMNTLFAGRLPDGTPLGIVHPRCVGLKDAILGWDGANTSKHKDIIDPARYAAERAAIVGGRVMFRAFY